MVRIKLPHALKGQSPYSEPREVKKVLGFWAYQLSDGKVWNARRLKKHWATTENEADDFEVIEPPEAIQPSNQPNEDRALPQQ